MQGLQGALPTGLRAVYEMDEATTLAYKEHPVQALTDCMVRGPKQEVWPAGWVMWVLLGHASRGRC